VLSVDVFLIFAASVRAFPFLSVAAFHIRPQRLGCHSDQMNVEFTHCDSYSESYRVMFEAILEASLCQKLHLPESDFFYGVNR